MRAWADADAGADADATADNRQCGSAVAAARRLAGPGRRLRTRAARDCVVSGGVGGGGCVQVVQWMRRDGLLSRRAPNSRGWLGFDTVASPGARACCPTPNLCPSTAHLLPTYCPLPTAHRGAPGRPSSSRLPMFLEAAASVSAASCRPRSPALIPAMAAPTLLPERHASQCLTLPHARQRPEPVCASVPSASQPALRPVRLTLPKPARTLRYSLLSAVPPGRCRAKLETAASNLLAPRVPCVAPGGVGGEQRTVGAEGGLCSTQ